jgi:hypothetical protein
VRMPSNSEILLRNSGERRSIGRTSINRDARILLPGQAGPRSCRVRDVTNVGAAIRLIGLKIVPLDFDLSFDNFRTLRKCRLVWREGDFVGVQLIS